MAKFVVAGSSDCPFFARIELLVDELQQRLPDFSVHKITLKPEDWQGWIVNTCEERGWVYNGKSPIIWRELISRGGKGSLVGSSNEFLEIAKGYYGLTLDKATAELDIIASENKKTKVALDVKEGRRVTCSTPYRITVTDAHTSAAYSLLPHLCTESLCTSVKDIYLTLLSCNMDSETEEKLKGISMELLDCGNCELRKVIVEKDVDNAFIDANLVVILNSSDVDKHAVSRLKSYGVALGKMKSDGKVIVAGRQPMIACHIISQHVAVGGIPSENFFALTRLQENKVKSALSKKLSVNTHDISDVILWGSSLEFILHHSDSTVKHYDGAIWAPHLTSFSHSINEMVYDKQWLTNELPKVLAPGEDAKETNIAHTAALISQLQQLLSSDQSSLFSLGVVSKGWYGIPEGVVFSLPVSCTRGKVVVREDVLLNEEMKEKIVKVATSLKQYCDELVKSEVGSITLSSDEF